MLYFENGIKVLKYERRLRCRNKNLRCLFASHLIQFALYQRKKGFKYDILPASFVYPACTCLKKMPKKPIGPVAMFDNVQERNRGTWRRLLQPWPLVHLFHTLCRPDYTPDFPSPPPRLTSTILFSWRDSYLRGGMQVKRVGGDGKRLGFLDGCIPTVHGRRHIHEGIEHRGSTCKH